MKKKKKSHKFSRRFINEMNGAAKAFQLMEILRQKQEANKPIWPYILSNI